MRTLIALLALAAITSARADDRLHPYYPDSTRAHSSLSPGSPQWFVPGYGYRTPGVYLAPPVTQFYRTPFQPAFQMRSMPLLSLQADNLQPYVHERIKAQPAQPWQYNSVSRAGNVWYLPGDSFRVDNPVHEYGQLR